VVEVQVCVDDDVDAGEVEVLRVGWRRESRSAAADAGAARADAVEQRFATNQIDA
jgi:hypothetical protein